MNSEERVRRQKELVERIGRHFEDEGFQPIAARIRGLLMVMDKERFTFDEIVEELNISKSTASTSLKNLQARGVVDYVTLPGERKRYFELKKKDAFDVIDEFERKTKELRNLLDEARDLKADKASPNARFFASMIKMFDLVCERIENVKEEFKNKI
jgi:DNA-binding transcriptional regulator GbsR (MarR family)